MRFHLLFFLLFVSSLIPSSVEAQNLVPNGNFEYKKGRRNSHRPWRFVNTVDFFVLDANSTKKMPNDTEKWNLPKPKDGKAYIGLRIYPDYREFVQIKLSEKLKPAQKYYFEMWISWSDHSNHYAKEFGASIYHKKPSYTSEYFIFGNPPQIVLKEESGIVQTDSTQWIKISGIYRAKGGERYLTIGNFSQTAFKDRLKKRKWWSLNFWHFEAYYFVDAVSLVPIQDYDVKKDSILVENIPDTLIADVNENYIYNIEKDSVLIIENLRFASGSDKILPSSYKDLELILEYLNENSTKNIDIIGHTDNVGSAANNLKLSERRAKSVYKYFIENRISKDRIQFIGKGETSPIESNETSLGKKANRRVEIKLVDHIPK